MGGKLPGWRSSVGFLVIGLVIMGTLVAGSQGLIWCESCNTVEECRKTPATDIRCFHSNSCLTRYSSDDAVRNPNIYAIHLNFTTFLDLTVLAFIIYFKLQNTQLILCSSEKKI